MKSLSYIVLGRGDVVISRTVDVPNVKDQVIRFLAAFVMVPKAQMIVYYVKDGEIVSDRLQIDFDDDLQNFVSETEQLPMNAILTIDYLQMKIEVSAQKTAPGQNVDITLISRPNSYVGLLGVDQSVLLLKKGNDLEKSQIFEDLDEYNLPFFERSMWRKKRFSIPYVDIWKDFNDAGVILLTNTRPMEYRKWNGSPRQIGSFEVKRPG